MKRPSGATKKAGIGGLGIAAIVGGVVAAGGAAAAAAGGGPGTPPPTTLSAVVSNWYTRSGNSLEAEYVGALPPPGNTISGHPNSVSAVNLVRVTLNVRNPSNTEADGCNVWVQFQAGGTHCLRVVNSSPFRLRPGESLQVISGTPAMDSGVLQNCPTPFNITTMVAMGRCTDGPQADWGFNCPGCLERGWYINMRFTP
jgi:hypothetical protein